MCIMQPVMRKPPNQTHAQALVTLRTGRAVPDLLRELYVEKGLSQAAIADELGVTRMTIAMWLREHSIVRPVAL